MSSPRALTIPGKHELLLPIISNRVAPGNGARVLDLGAGEGALSLKLKDLGYSVSACDLFPDMFCCDDVECRQADLLNPLPYEDNEFDLLVCFEVLEHLESHLNLFKEI